MLFGAPRARAQQRPKRIGWLRPGTPDPERLAAFKLGMREQGYVEGRDYEMVIREGRGIDNLGKMADELVAMKVDAIFVGGTPSAQAAARSTREIPIFISSVNDPVAAGLVSNLARPGTNITGLMGLSDELIPKRLELLREIVPNVKTFAFIYDPDSGVEHNTAQKVVPAAAAKLRLNHIVIAFRPRDSAAGLFQKITAERIDALLLPNNYIMRDPAFIAQIVKHRLPAIFAIPESAEAGGLLSYSPDVNDQTRRVAGHVSKVFKGAKPAELPIEQPTKFELVVNLKTAKALGITVPQTILLRADRVIE